MNTNNKKWLQRISRAGLAAKGLIHCLLGGIAVMAAMGLTSKEGSKKEAFGMIYDQPFGRVLLIVLGCSLIGFVVYRVMQAFGDSENKGTSAKGLAFRLGKAGSALVYSGICFYAFRLALLGKAGGESKQLLISKVLDVPWGQAIVAIAGCWMAGVGVYQIYKAFSGKFMKNLHLRKSSFEKTFKTIGVVGYTARGVVFITLGYFIVRAALNNNAREAEDTGGAFDFLQNNFGPWLMMLIAAGLFLYGAFLFVKARYQEVKV